MGPLRVEKPVFLTVFLVKCFLGNLPEFRLLFCSGRVLAVGNDADIAGG